MAAAYTPRHTHTDTTSACNNRHTHTHSNTLLTTHTTLIQKYKTHTHSRPCMRPYTSRLTHPLIDSLTITWTPTFVLSHTHSHDTLRHPHNRLMMLMSRLGQELMDPSHSNTQVCVCVYICLNRRVWKHTLICLVHIPHSYNKDTRAVPRSLRACLQRRGFR